jgi:hypothetical protein
MSQLHKEKEMDNESAIDMQFLLVYLLSDVGHKALMRLTFYGIVL